MQYFESSDILRILLIGSSDADLRLSRWVVNWRGLRFGQASITSIVLSENRDDTRKTTTAT